MGQFHIHVNILACGVSVFLSYLPHCHKSQDPDVMQDLDLGMLGVILMNGQTEHGSRCGLFN